MDENFIRGFLPVKASRAPSKIAEPIITFQVNISPRKNTPITAAMITREVLVSEPTMALT